MHEQRSVPHETDGRQGACGLLIKLDIQE